LRYLFEDYTLHTQRRELRRGADIVAVAPQVFDLLEYLIRNKERVVSKDDLIKTIWDGRIVSDGALTTRLNAARSAIGDTGEEQRLIKTFPRKDFASSGRCGKRKELQTLALTNLQPAQFSRYARLGDRRLFCRRRCCQRDGRPCGGPQSQCGDDMGPARLDLSASGRSRRSDPKL
jgi:DNA-binding winged helix-turn-helix (wHTH) protein